MVLDGARDSGNEEVYQHYKARLIEAQEREALAFIDAEKAYNAVRLLIPTAADVTRRYLDLCNDADMFPDEKQDARERARHTAEEAMRTALDA